MNAFPFQKHIRSARGFTLVELLVTLGLFSMVIVLATGALFSAQAINARLQQTQVILDGVNLAIEVMSRDIRYGSNFYCSSATSSPITTLARSSCTSGNTILVFHPAIPLSTSNPTADRVAYYRSATGAIYKQEYPAGVAVSSALRITPADVTISTLTFYLIGAESTPTDYNQPLVTISVAGLTRPAKQGVAPVAFTVQTSSASRKLDN